VGEREVQCIPPTLRQPQRQAPPSKRVSYTFSFLFSDACETIVCMGVVFSPFSSVCVASFNVSCRADGFSPAPPPPPHPVCGRPTAEADGAAGGGGGKGAMPPQGLLGGGGCATFFLFLSYLFDVVLFSVCRCVDVPRRAVHPSPPLYSMFFFFSFSVYFVNSITLLSPVRPGLAHHVCAWV
jgi:hypothetical protein